METKDPSKTIEDTGAASEESNTERQHSRRFALKLAAAAGAAAFAPKGMARPFVQGPAESSTDAETLLDIEQLVTEEMNRAAAVGLPVPSAQNLDLVMQRASELTGGDTAAAWNCLSTFCCGETCLSSLLCIWEVAPDPVGHNDAKVGAALGTLTDEGIAQAGGVEAAAQAAAAWVQAQKQGS